MIATKKSQFCVQQHLVVKKKLFLVGATEKCKNLLNFDCLRRKRVTRTFKRTFFEDTSKTSVFTSLQKIRILLGRKKRPAPKKRLCKTVVPEKSKLQILKSELWGKLVGRHLGWCGFTVRVRGAGAVHVRANFCPHTGVWDFPNFHPELSKNECIHLV